MPRSKFKFILCFYFFTFIASGSFLHAQSNVIDIGDRLELFVDHFLIDRLDGTQLKLAAPVLAPLSEHPTGYLAYATVFKDSNVYRMYGRGCKTGGPDGNKKELTVYYESKDGINWYFPELALYQTDWYDRKNVILAHNPPFSHNFTPFIDKNPDCPVEQKYKALAGVEKSGLYAFVSADGVHWKKMFDKPVLTDGMFDSQNIAFWSEHEGCYVCYFRTWTGEGYEGLRTISRSTSKDFENWTKTIAMNPNDTNEHLYTSAINPYFRAPHIYISLPTRFLPDRGNSTDILFMSSRGGNTFDRTFMEAFIRPGLDPQRWLNRANYATLNVVPTGYDEMSIYMREKRYTLRTDGFVSVNAPYKGGDMLTKPFIFKGDSLVINFATAASGMLQVEIQDEFGNPLEGFSLSDCPPVIGDEIEKTVCWQNGASVSRLAGTPVRLRFYLQDADLYSIRFK